LVRLSGIRGFVEKQSHNYRMILVRSAGANFLMNLTRNYFSIYTTGLGADSVTLGGIRSVSSAVNMLISIPSGWLSDTYNLKKVMGVGMAIQVLMVALLALAKDWTWVLVSMALDPFTMALMFRSQTVMMSNALKDGDRATGFGLRQIFGQLVGITAPIPSALIVGYFGGLNVEGIRPLFYLRTVGLVLLYAYVYTRLEDVPPQPRPEKSSVLEDFREVLAGGEGLKTWIVVSGIGSMVWGMMEPFTFLYAAEVKGADALTLGIMTTVSTLASIILSLPVNQIADTRGRKFAIFLIRPALYIWMIMVVLAPSPQWLILAWIFRGIGLSSTAYDTIALELVPPSQRGRWLGITNAFSSIARIPAPLIGGFLYRGGHSYLIFLIPLFLDLGLRMPLLGLKIPETGINTPQEK
jgi:MFS family permease